MKISFSTLACPDWDLLRVFEIASRSGYDGVELRFVQGEHSLWKLPAFQAANLAETRTQISNAGLSVCCVDTSCHFDSPDANERERWITEGERMAELAAQLGAPGIRVFGDRIQPGATRKLTTEWVADCLTKLSKKIANTGVEVWLETHGDFAHSSVLSAILCGCPGIGLVWDPAVMFENNESPLEYASGLQSFIRHIHIKDIRRINGEWFPALNGEGSFPLEELRTALEQSRYDKFLSFEWEKKWHPSIAPPEVALPHFVNWYRTHWLPPNSIPADRI